MPTSPRFIVASYNVHKCVGTDGKFDPDRILTVIEELQADVVALQEADMRFGKRHGLLDLTKLRDRTGLVLVDLPQRSRENSHGWHGNVVLVREGVAADAHSVALPGLEPRGAVVVDIDVAGGFALRVVAAHLGLIKRWRQQQIDLLSTLVREDRDHAVLIMGDFNEWRTGGGSSLRRLEPLFGPVAEHVPSFPSRRPTLSLDRILARPQQIIQSLAVHDTPTARVASDHLPLRAYVDISSILAGGSAPAPAPDGWVALAPER
jgi:endonuclease/exonuclease/phosphatase family metal-dependent hydrolase